SDASVYELPLESSAHEQQLYQLRHAGRCLLPHNGRVADVSQSPEDVEMPHNDICEIVIRIVNPFIIPGPHSRNPPWCRMMVDNPPRIIDDAIPPLFYFERHIEFPVKSHIVVQNTCWKTFFS